MNTIHCIFTKQILGKSIMLGEKAKLGTELGDTYTLIKKRAKSEVQTKEL